MMDSFELNKLIGALLAVVFVVFSVSIVSDAIFATHAPATPGYAIVVAEAETDSGGAAEEAGPSVLDLIATADVAAGQTAFRKCTACHTAEEGGANKVGPNLYGVLNRPIASHEGFSYSAAMRDFSQGGSVVWDYEHLSGFLQSPRSYVSGTAMAFAGIRNIQEEANLIAYLRSLSADPAPLPAAAAEEAPAESAPAEAAPAEEQPESPAEGTAPQPTPQDDGTSAAPEPDAGTESGERPAEEAPAQQ
jgi:cytochrome c